MSTNIADMRAVATKARTFLSDPGRVVLDPYSLYEAEDGSPFLGAPNVEPPRMCFVGAVLQGAGPNSYMLWSKTLEALEQEAGEGNLTNVLRKGGADACVAVIDRFLAKTDD